MAGSAVTIAILANARNAVAGLQETGDAAQRMGAEVEDAGREARAGLEEVARATQSTEDRLDAAGRASGAFADKLDFIGGAAAKLAGGIGDVADGLAANGIISEQAAEKADQFAKGLMVVAGAADIFTTASALMAAAQNANAVASVRAAAASVTSRTATLASAAATKVATVAQWLWNAAMAANPIGLIVLAIVALIAGLVLAYQHSETFRRVVTAAFQAVASAAKAVVAGVVAYISFVLDMYAKVYNFGRNIVRGLVDGIQSAIGWLKDKIRALGNLIPDSLKKVLGIRSPSKVMAAIGRDTMRGLAGGIESQLPALRRTMAGVSGTVTGLSTEARLTLADATAVPTTSPGSGTGGAAYTINVAVPPTVDPAEVGRQVVQAVEAFERRTGRRPLAVA